MKVQSVLLGGGISVENFETTCIYSRGRWKGKLDLEYKGKREMTETYIIKFKHR